MSESKIQNYEKQRNGRLLGATFGLLAVVVAITINILYTSHSQRVNDQRWCALITSLELRTRSLPPSQRTPESLRFLEQVTTLREGLHCSLPPGPAPSQSPRPTATG